MLLRMLVIGVLLVLLAACSGEIQDLDRNATYGFRVEPLLTP
jgi:hypothetical protein